MPSTKEDLTQADQTQEQKRLAQAERVRVAAFKYSQELPQERPEYIAPRNRSIIALFLEGFNYRQIAEKVGMSPAGVSRVIKSPSAARVYSEVASLHRLRLAALTGPAIETLMKQLDSPNGTIALKAADMILQTQGMYKEAQKADNTAAGVIASMKEMIQQGQMRVRAIHQTNTVVEAEPQGSPAERGLGADTHTEETIVIDAAQVPGLGESSVGAFPLETTLPQAAQEMN